MMTFEELFDDDGGTLSLLRSRCGPPHGRVVSSAFLSAGSNPRLRSAVMVVSGLTSPVVLNGLVSDEKLSELLGLQTEYPELDYKKKIDLTATAGLVELVKDVGAMQVRGAYIVAGVDGHGAPTGDMDGVDARLFDESTLVPKLLRYLPQPLEVRSRVLEREGHTIALIYVGRHPAGCAIFHTDGQYERHHQPVIVFRAGDVFWRDGTRSVRISQQGFEEIIERRIADAKSAWLEEQHEIRRHEQTALQAAYESRRLADAALGTVNLDLAPEALNLAALELVRADDTIALRHLLSDARSRAGDMIERDEIETELADVLDKVSCLAATFLEYEQEPWFERVVGTLAQIYSMPLGEHDARRFGYSTWIDPSEKAPRIWLLIAERIYALGALAVRLGDWKAVRTLTLQLPDRLDHEYDANWLRHALTMASRAQHLDKQQDGHTVHVSLLSLAHKEAQRVACLRTDGLDADDDALITSLAQFDFLSNLAAIDGADDTADRVFWPNFARFRQERIQPLADLILQPGELRKTIFPRHDQQLTIALTSIARSARQEGLRYDGFRGWERTPVGKFIAATTPQQT
jgi:hypothetical protein